MIRAASVKLSSVLLSKAFFIAVTLELSCWRNIYNEIAGSFNA